MSLQLTASQNNYIILTQNKIMTAHQGVKIFIKTRVVTPQKSAELYSRLSNSPNYTNNIILNYKFSNAYNCLLTINNIKNNIKFLFTDSTNKKNGKILFVKNNNVANYKLNNNYLIFATNNEVTTSDSKNLTFHLNYYFNNVIINNNIFNYFNTISGTTNYNYDYYKLNVKDYILRDYSYNFFVSSIGNDICYNKLNFKISAISEDYSSNLYIDVCSNNFNRLSDISNISKLVKYNNNTTYYPIYNNIYNKYYVYNKNINYDVILTCSGNTLTISFDTFLIKTNTFEIAKNAQSKILFDTNNTIYFLNVQVSTPSKPIVEKLTKPHIVYLSLGNFRTGLVQSDIYNHIALTPNMEKVYFKENITANVIKNPINVAKKYSTLIPYLANHYLYDIELSANILLKSVTINTIYTSINKIFTVNFSNFFDLSNLRNYYNNFNNLAFITTVSNNIIRPVVNYFDSSNNYNINSISFDIVSVTSANLYTRNSTAQTLLNSYYTLIKPALLDVRFNYDSYFYTNFTFNILYNYPTKYEIINTYVINFGCLIYTTPARDFTDVECIYIYHNPETDPNPLYRYPYNNIEIIRDPSNIDTLAKAIELLPGASSSTSNSIIIPEKNGSNLSRKMIQGLIGLNNVPKLLSIKPYDENVIVGRGFVNQYQIDNTCITTTEDIIKNKINANKHSSAKDSRTFTTNKLGKQNFANLVRSNRRNRLSQQCIEDLREDIRNNTPLATQVNYANIVPYTPRFKIFKTGQGHYL